MTTTFVHRALIAASVAGIALAIGLPGDARAADAVDETVKQTSRQIADAIARRLGTQVQQNTIAAGLAGGRGGDMQSSGSLWFTTSYHDLDFVTKGAPDADLDVYELVGGGDMKFDRWIVGASLSYAHAVAGGLAASSGAAVSSGNIKVNSYTLSPYASYLLTDHLYPLALLGFSHSAIADDPTSSNTWFTDLSMNYGNVVDAFVLRAKLGYRFNHTNLDNVGGGDDTSNTHVLYTSGLVGYAMGLFVPYIGLQYEYDATHQVTGSKTDRHYLYANLGFDFQPNADFTFGAALQLETINEESNNVGAILNARFRF